MAFVWDEEHSDRLSTLYRDGLSFALIAAKIGCSRNAAIGRAHRMKLSGRDATIDKIVKKAKRPMNAPIKVKPAPPSRVNGHDCTIYDLTEKSCRFPLWAHEEPQEFDGRFYCGSPEADVYAGKPYCRYHARLCAPERP